MHVRPANALSLKKKAAPVRPSDREKGFLRYSLSQPVVCLFVSFGVLLLVVISRGLLAALGIALGCFLNRFHQLTVDTIHTSLEEGSRASFIWFVRHIGPHVCCAPPYDDLNPSKHL